MDPLVPVFVSLRRGLRAAIPLLAASSLALVVAVHAAHPLDERVFAGFIVVSLGLLAARAWQRQSAMEHDLRRDVELGTLLAVTAYATTIHVDHTLHGAY
jgi:hypothetical protein